MATIMLFAADFAPKNWAYCNGQIMAINTNTALFSLLGTTYGGNGVQNFALPDFQGRTAIGSTQQGSTPGRSTYVLGQKAGSPTVTLTVSNLAIHNHPTTATLAATSAAPNTDEGPNNILAGTNIYAAGANGTLGGVSEQPSGITGSSAPVNIQQPYLGLNYVICLYGIYPSRN